MTKSYVTYVTIEDGKDRPTKLLLTGRISTAISKLKKDSPMPSWFWKNLYLTKTQTYIAKTGERVTMTLEEERLDE